MPTVRLNKNRDRSLRRRHPWVFSGAISTADSGIKGGEIVRVEGYGGQFLAWGYYNAKSNIRVRVLDWDEGAVIDDSWWRKRIESAIALRADLPSLRSTDARRLVHAEADGLPGLIVDRYEDYLVIQVLSAGIERARTAVIGALEGLLAPRGIYERSDADGRRIEGLEPASGVIAGEKPPDRLRVKDGALAFDVSIPSGHKTGFYLDQRDNRRLVAGYASGRRVLDVFGYSGAFTVHCLTKKASAVTLVESSADALAMARSHLAANDLDEARCEFVQGNAFDELRSYRDSGRRFDMVILDPPKFAQTQSQLTKAERAYKDINLIAMKILEPGGILATFSCSGAVGAEHFARIVAWASIDAGRNAHIIARMTQAADHPVLPTFPESEYLTGLLCRVA